MSFEEAVVRSSKFAGIPGSYPVEPILGRAREWRLRGMKRRSRGRGGTAGVEFESGPRLSMIDDGGF